MLKTGSDVDSRKRFNLWQRKVYSIYNLVQFKQHKDYGFATNIYILLVLRQQLIGIFVVQYSWNFNKSTDILVDKHGDLYAGPNFLWNAGIFQRLPHIFH